MRCQLHGHDIVAGPRSIGEFSAVGSACRDGIDLALIQHHALGPQEPRSQFGVVPRRPHGHGDRLRFARTEWPVRKPNLQGLLDRDAILPSLEFTAIEALD